MSKAGRHLPQQDPGWVTKPEGAVTCSESHSLCVWQTLC